jgi:putative intracellular protease/amidase
MEVVMKILMVLTSHDQLGNTDKKTGFWLEEFASPYYQFLDNGAKITLASPKGGRPPVDPNSTGPDSQTEMTKRFNEDSKAQADLAVTTKLSDIDYQEYDAVFYPGGHGPMWDLAKDQDSIQLIENFIQAGKPVAAVCHAPAALQNVKIDGEPLVKGKKVTGFTNSEEEAMGLTDVVPFLLEDELKRLGGNYEKADNFESFVLADGLLITGQNPASSEDAAKKLIEVLENKETSASKSKDSLGGETSMNP